MISSKIFFTGLLLMIILLCLTKLAAKKVFRFSENEQAILGGLVVVVIFTMIISMFGIIWGI